MKETGILFTAPMVRAILDGRKTQTRRVVKMPPWVSALGGDLSRAFADNGGGANIFAGAGEQYLHVPCTTDDSVQRVYSPFGVPGDRLWVREAWRVGECADGFSPRELDPRTWKVDNGGLWYDATETEPKHPISPRGRYRHARFMPRWASRITLDVINVRVERLQEISEADVLAEGLSKLSKDGGRLWKFGMADRDGLPGNDDHGWHWQEWEVSARDAYRKLWTQINGPESWDTNPWVWVLDFTSAAA